MADPAGHFPGCHIAAGIGAGAYLAGKRMGQEECTRPAGSCSQLRRAVPRRNGRNGASRPGGHDTRRRAHRSSPSLPPCPLDREHLAAETAGLRRQLGGARESAQAAWDATTAPRDHGQHCRHVCPSCGGCDICCACYRSGLPGAGGKRAALLAGPLTSARQLTPR